MQIQVRLFASLSQYRDHPLLSRDGLTELASPVSVGHLVDDLNIPRKEITLIFINGVHAAMDTVLKDGDRLGLFPPIGGG